MSEQHAAEAKRLRHFRSPRTGAWRSALVTFTLLTSIFSSTIGATAPVAAFSAPLSAVTSTFEMDGNTASDGGVDWNSLFSATPTNPASWPGAPSNLLGRAFAADDFSPSTDNSYFKGSTTDGDAISNWQCVVQDNATNKDDLFNAYAAVFAAPVGSAQHEILYVGSERSVNTGDSFAGFWILQDAVGCNPPATGSAAFTGSHRNGDLLLLTDYTNGGTVASLNVFQWKDGAPVAVSTITGGDCQDAAANPTWLSCGRTNPTSITTPWVPGDSSLASNTFVEAGVDLTQAFGGAVPCGARFLAETRSSQQITATLKDYTMATFKNCVTPTVSTQLKRSADNGSLTSPKNPTAAQIPQVASGTLVYDTAALSNTAPGALPQGTLTYSWYNDPGCTTAAGSSGPLTLTSGTAPQSVNVPVSGTNAYYFKASYSGDLSLGGLNQPSTSACQDANEQVQSFIPAPHLGISKSTTTPSVSAGSPVNYTVALTNDAPQSTGVAASGVSLSDNLPGSGVLSWSVETQPSLPGVDCSITGSPQQVLNCGPSGNETGTFSLGLGQTLSVTVQSSTTAAACGTYSNQATAKSSNGNSPTSNSVSVIVLCPDLTVHKTADAGTISAGDTAGFSIIVGNAGPGVATAATLSDPLPAGLSWTISPAVAGCSISSGTLSCAFGNLASGASTVVHVQAATSAFNCGVLNNTATVAAANEPAANQSNDTSSASVAVNCANVSISKTADSTAVSAGDAIGFLVTVTNSGTGNAYNVAVSDALPANPGLAWTIDAAHSDSGCSISSGTLGCNFGTLALGASRHVHITSPTTSATCGSVNNGATASTSNAGSAGPASASVTVNCPDIVVTKTADAGTISAGDTAGFTIVVGNSGAGTARTVALTDPLPAGASWSITPSVSSCSISGGTLACSFGDLASGASASVHISGPATATANCAPLNNTASATSANERPADTGNNASSATVNVNCAQIHLVKVADAASVSAGDPVGFLITVTNRGDGIARSVTAHDTLPTNPGLSWSIDSAHTDTGCSIAASVLSCSFADIESEGSRHVHITSLTTPATCGTVNNTATASATNDGSGGDSASIAVNCPDITVTKTADSTAISAGDRAAFTIVVSNVGTGTAYSVTLNDPLPGSVAWSLPAATGCFIASGTLNCNFGDFAPGESRTVHVSGDSSAADCPALANTVSVAAMNERDVDNSNNTSSATITVGCANIHISKSADAATVSAGNQVGFTVTVMNSGAGTARTVTVTDPLPNDAGLSWSIDATHSDIGCAISSGTLTCKFGDVAPGASRLFHTTSNTTSATCAAGEGTGTVRNTATVTASNDGSGSASASTVVRCPNLSLTKTVGSASVDAGQPISFTITLANSNSEGTGATSDVTLSDPLPPRSGVSWSLDGGFTVPEGVNCVISGSAPSQTLSCGSGTDGNGPFTLEPGDSVHAVVTSATTSATCGTLSNTVRASAPFNAPSALSASASANVRCVSAIATTPNVPFGTVGVAIHDTATVSGPGHPAGGTVSFALYGPDDTACQTNLVASTADFSQIPLVNGSASSPDFTTTTVGIYQWVAHYSGDDHNLASDGACGDPNEQVVTSEVLGEVSLAQTGSIALAVLLSGLPLLVLGFLLWAMGRRRARRNEA